MSSKNLKNPNNQDLDTCIVVINLNQTKGEGNFTFTTIRDNFVLPLSPKNVHYLITELSHPIEISIQNLIMKIMYLFKKCGQEMIIEDITKNWQSKDSYPVSHFHSESVKYFNSLACEFGNMVLSLKNKKTAKELEEITNRAAKPEEAPSSKLETLAFIAGLCSILTKLM